MLLIFPYDGANQNFLQGLTIQRAPREKEREREAHTHTSKDANPEAEQEPEFIHVATFFATQELALYVVPFQLTTSKVLKQAKIERNSKIRRKQKGRGED